MIRNTQLRIVLLSLLSLMCCVGLAQAGIDSGDNVLQLNATNGELGVNVSDYNILAKNWLQTKSRLMINEFLVRNNLLLMNRLCQQGGFESGIS